MDCSPPGSSVHGIPRQEFWSGLPFPPLGDLPNPGIKLRTPLSPELAGQFFTTEPPRKPIHTWGHFKHTEPVFPWGEWIRSRLPTQGTRARPEVPGPGGFHRLGAPRLLSPRAAAPKALCPQQENQRNEKPACCAKSRARSLQLERALSPQGGPRATTRTKTYDRRQNQETARENALSKYVFLFHPLCFLS